MTLLARYFFTSDRESLAEDGVSDFSTEDLALLTPVAVLKSRDSLPKIKLEIEDATSSYVSDISGPDDPMPTYSWTEEAPDHWHLRDAVSNEHFASLVLQSVEPL